MNTAGTNTVIRPCVAQDLEEVLVMNNAAIPSVNQLDLDALMHLWQQSLHLQVLDVDGALGAFMLLLDGPGCQYDSVNYAWFSERYERFFYVDRIVVSEAHRGRGMGRTLYNWAIEQEASAYPVLCAEVNIRPRNQPSLDFHAAMEFVEVGQQDTENGQRTVMMLARTLPPTPLP